MNTMLNVSVSPHLRAETDTPALMRDVAIALLPACIFGVYNNGYRAAVIILISVATALLTEFLFEKLVRRTVTVGDWSAVVTGLLLAVNLPASVPYWMPALGSLFAILVVKQLFGGIGQNFMNPALAGRCFLLISFTAEMTNFVYDGVAGATPLAALKAGESVDLVQMFLGTHGGCIGETSVLAILVGAAYLLIKRVISIRIPGIYILSTLVFVVILNLATGAGMPDGAYLLAQLFGGGLLLGAFFMATDYVTSPVTPWGQVIYALLLGFLTALFRVVGKSAEGVSYAIILSNIVVPLIERVTVPLAFGMKRGKKGGAKA